MEIKSKKDIRAEVKEKRREADLKKITEDSQKISAAFLKLPEYQAAKTILAYVDCKNEVQTKKIIEHCWKAGKKVAVPRVFGKDIKFYEIFSFDDLENGCFGLLEPKHEILQEIEWEDGLMIMPGVAFDVFCHRVGYGAGYYDRYLKKYPAIKKIALAFEFQIYDQVPYESFDIQPEKIITEKRIIV